MANKTKAPRAKRGVKAGLKDGETRVTCVMTDDMSQVLHDFAKTYGKTFREVTMKMADSYIETYVRRSIEKDGKMRTVRGAKPPIDYEYLYEEWDEAEFDPSDSFIRG